MSDSTRTEIELALQGSGLWDGKGRSPVLDETAAFAVAAKAGYTEISLARSALYLQPWMAVIDVPNVDTCVIASSPALAIVLAVLKATMTKYRWVDVLVASFDAMEHTSLMTLAEQCVRDVANGDRPLSDLLQFVTEE